MSYSGWRAQQFYSPWFGGWGVITLFFVKTVVIGWVSVLLLSARNHQGQPAHWAIKVGMFLLTIYCGAIFVSLIKKKIQREP